MACIRRSTNVKVLCVEDNCDTCEMLCELLRLDGYDVDCAADAEGGIDALRSDRYDVVVSDYNLPDRSGTAMLRTARDEGLLAKTVSILLTAHPCPELFDGLMLVMKPLSIDPFLATLRTLTENQRCEGAAEPRQA